MSIKKMVNEHGQNLVIIAVVMVALIALVGLAVDGGFGLANRRKAQNAADAGALAGADALCAGEPNETVISQALDYAINRNEATDASVTIGTKVLTVTTAIPHQTFLMGLFGEDVITSTASASAGCYFPCSATVLPVAWSCEPPIVNGEPITDTCGIQWGTMDDPGPLYVIMDSNKIPEDIYCQEPPLGCPYAIPTPGAMDCELNGDCVNDLFAGGNRSWLNLNGGSGNANELRDWINGINVPELHTHYWYGGSTGNKEVAYKAAGDRIGDLVLIPVFDRYCLDVPETNCPALYDPGDETVYASNDLIYYRIISFSAFRITCVVAPGVKKTCSHPARDAAIDALIAQGILKKSDANNLMTIEGYFVRDYAGDGKCEGPDTGVYTIYLNH
jgi:hypothetical protein